MYGTGKMFFLSLEKILQTKIWLIKGLSSLMTEMSQRSCDSINSIFIISMLINFTFYHVIFFSM